MFHLHFNPRPPRGGRLEKSADPHIHLPFQSTPPARGATYPPTDSRYCEVISIHAPREGGDARRARHTANNNKFQSTPPARGATRTNYHPHNENSISIHAPREGGDDPFLPKTKISLYFNPRPPRGGRLCFCFAIVIRFINFNPRPPRGGRLYDFAPGSPYFKISIHAPREGGDSGYQYEDLRLVVISIHAPREGGDCFCFAIVIRFINFNPRPPRGGRRVIVPREPPLILISIHAPREGGDAVVLRSGPVCFPFQSTPPARGATCCCYRWVRYYWNFNPRPPRGGRRAFSLVSYRGYLISIHAPREGGDDYNSKTKTKNKNFNPRPPRGGRQQRGTRVPRRQGFQSTPPARGATKANNGIKIIQHISIHAPREGGDGTSSCVATAAKNFNPRPPRGGRR